MSNSAVKKKDKMRGYVDRVLSIAIFLDHQINRYLKPKFRTFVPPKFYVLKYACIEYLKENKVAFTEESKDDRDKTIEAQLDREIARFLAGSDDGSGLEKILSTRNETGNT